MATILSMPKWGLAMKTGLVVEWLKQVGDSVREGEPIVEIESEKATNEVEAPATGTVRWIGVQEGERAPVGESLLVIAAPGEELTDEQVATLLREEAEARQKREEMLKQRSAPKAAATAPSRTVRTPTGAGGRVNASPAARRLAQELGVDLATVAGTGPGGMIGREDVLRAAEEVKAATASEEAEERDVEVDGIAAHCLIAGPVNAPHVVFVHGLGGSIPTWSLNLPAFAERFRICAVDLVGAGSSAKPAQDYSVSNLADFLARFLDALGPDWQRVSIVAHSLGGAVALAFANQHPDRVEKLVLIDSAGLGPEINPTLLDLVHTEPTPEHIRAELALFFTNPDLVQQALVEQLYQQRTQSGAREALQATADAAFSGGQQRIDMREALTKLSQPVLLIWGAADAVIPEDHAQLAQLAQQGRLVVLANCGHCPHIERSDEFNQRAMAFLNE
jgi:pimeloyl-ACP methyl ester carboxylesterase